MNFPDYPYIRQRFTVRPGIAMSVLDENRVPFLFKRYAALTSVN